MMRCSAQLLQSNLTDRVLRFQGGKIKGMSEKNISKCLKIHKRITSADYRVQELIGMLDDLFGSRHSLSAVQNLDILVVRTHVAGQETVSRDLLLWATEHFKMDVDRGTVAPDAAKAPFGLSISRALLKKRIVNFLHKKFPPPKASETTETWRSINDIFGSMSKFRLSGLEQGSTLAMPWRVAMPPHIQDVTDFLTSLIRGGVLENVLDSFLEKDSLASAEVVLASTDVKATFDLPAALEAARLHGKKNEPEAPEKVPEPPAPTPETTKTTDDVHMEPPAAEDRAVIIASVLKLVVSHAIRGGPA